MISTGIASSICLCHLKVNENDTLSYTRGSCNDLKIWVINYIGHGSVAGVPSLGRGLQKQALDTPRTF